MTLCMCMTSHGLLRLSSLKKNLILLRCSKRYVNFFKEKKGAGIVKIRSDHGT